MTTTRRKPVRAGRGQGQGRGLIDEHESPTLNSGFGDTDIQMSPSPPPPPLESVDGHHSHESSNPTIYSVAGMDSQGAAPTASSSTSIKNVRGMAKCQKLSNYVSKNGPFVLNIPNRHRAPIGKNCSWFASKIGELLRNMCELHHDEWKKVPVQEKSKLLHHIRSNFALNMGQYEHVKAVRIKMSRAYSRLRSNLYRDHYKKYFKGIDAHNAEEIARAKAIGRETVPKGYGPEQWKLICDSFDDESWKKKSERNIQNRSRLETNHTSGTCSFVNFIYKREQETKVKPNFVELYEATHTKKDREFVTTKCKSLYLEMKELTSNEAMEEGNVDGRSAEDRMEEIVTKVLGGRRSGHVRGMGCGLIPTPLSSSQGQSFTQFENHDECKKRQEDTQNELQHTKFELQETKNTLQDTQNTLQVTNNTLQATIDQTKKLQETVDFLMSRIGGSGGSLTRGESSQANN